MYENAIRESFAYLGVPVSSFTGYYTQKKVDLAQALNRIQRVMEQKWLALNSISSVEAWNDYRRLGCRADLPQSLQSPSPDPACRPGGLPTGNPKSPATGKKLPNRG